MPTTTLTHMPDEPLAAEDAKLVTLARSTRARTSAAEGAALRDTDGRTYAAATVDLPSLRLTALQVCIGMAVSSGSRGLETAVLLTDAGQARRDDLSAVQDFAGTGVPVLVRDGRGNPVETTTS